MISTDITKRKALKFVILIGLVSLFADMTYEGARSITGQYLAILGANALTVGFVSGFGELIGYSLRLVSGYLADRTGKYWLITIIGYICNLLAVPLLALAGHWWIAASLMILERLGKAIRVPTRDAMLSHAAQQTGMGWGFGLHKALDQTGAMIGPLVVALILLINGNYREGFAVLLIPAFISLAFLFYARSLYPHPKSLELKKDNLQATQIKNKSFWLYLLGASLIAAGFADFPLIAFHFQKQNILPNVWIPVVYAIAMGIDGLAALLLGHFYDKKGFIILILITVFSSLFAPLVFLGHFKLALLGVVLWSIGVGAHESLMRAVVANMIPSNKRASAYGTFNMFYGVFWFLGSIIMGALYDYSIFYVVIFSLFIQLAALPILWVVMNQLKKME
jgi:MFS family permease